MWVEMLRGRFVGGGIIKAHSTIASVIALRFKLLFD
jgi:hypothetical protein